MQVAVSTLYGPNNLTIVEAGEGADAWIFIPLETGPATVHVFEGRYLFAYGYISDWAIFDLEQRRRIAGPQTVLALPHIFCFSAMHRSFFLAEQRAPKARYNRIHQIPVDSGLPRTHELPEDAHVHQLACRDDGAIIGLSHGMEQGTVRHVLHPRTGEVQTDSLTDALYWSVSNYGPRWISPDGRWALRNALDTPLLAQGRRAGLLDRFMPERQAGAKHPDLRDDGESRYALALELIELAPLHKASTLMVAYRTPKELDLYPADVALLDAWFRRPAAERPMLLPRSHAERMNPEQAEVAKLAEGKFLNRLDDVVWAEDSRSFSIRVGEYKVPWDDKNIGFYRQSRRQVGIDGSIGELQIVESRHLHPAWPDVSERAYKIAETDIKRRSTQSINLGGMSVVDFANAIDEMTRRITENPLSDVTFAGALRFQFQAGRKRLNERKLFELIRAVPVADAEPVIEALRGLLVSYGDATRRHATERPGDRLMSGTDDHAPAALSEAALSLATLDDRSAAALRVWFRTVDQEHDGFAAEKVFPAYAARTGFLGVEALRFGIWFFLNQWQTVSFEQSWLGLFDVASRTIAPEMFARVAREEARLVANDEARADEAAQLSDYLDRLTEQIGNTEWGNATADQLRKLERLP